MTTTPAVPLTRARGVAIYLSALLGAGLLAMPALTYQAAGPASVLAWGALLLLSAPVAFTFARLGVVTADASGVGGFVSRAFGARAGQVVSVWFVLAVPFGAPSAALVGAAYVTRALSWPVAATPEVAAALLVAATASAWGGLRLSGAIQIGLTALLFVALTVACVGAVPHLTVAHLHPFAPHGFRGVATAIGVLFFSFAGWEAVAPITREFADPRRDVRRVTSWTLVLVSALYLALSVMSILVLGPELGRTSTPVQALLAVSVGPLAAPITGLLAAALTFGAMTAYLSGAARMASALARDGRLPLLLAEGHERGRTPRIAVVAVSALALAVLALADVSHVSLGVLMSLASAMFIAVTGAGLVAGVRLLRVRSAQVVAGVSAVVMIVVLAGCGWAALYPLVVAAVAGGRSARRPAISTATVEGSSGGS